MSAERGPGHARLGIALLLAGGLTLPLVLSPEPARALQLTVDDQRDGVDANPDDGVCATQGVIVRKCTLRAAVQQANELAGSPECPTGCEIRLKEGTYTLTLTGGDDKGGDLDITGDLTIIGAGAGKTIIEAGNGVGRVLQVGVEGKRPINVTIKGVTIRNGNARAETSTDMSCDAEGEQGGGGICVAGAILTLNQSTVEGSGAIFGGGIVLGWGGTLHLIDSTIADNKADDSGGGILVFRSPDGTLDAGSTLSLERSTIARNTAADAGGGIAVFDAQGVSLRNSTISGNDAARGAGIFFQNGCEEAQCQINNVTVAFNMNGTGWFGLSSGAPTFSNTLFAGNTPSDCSGTLSSAGFNLIQKRGTDCMIVPDDTTNIGGDPKLDRELKDNGSKTQTHALLKDSPAVNKGNPAPFGAAPACEERDQRGKPRDGTCDIGAYEAQITDNDKDGIPDSEDNCPSVSNPGQRDTDGDGIGDACDPCKFQKAEDPPDGDNDGDTVLNSNDCCPETPAGALGIDLHPGPHNGCGVVQSCRCTSSSPGFCSHGAWITCVKRAVRRLKVDPATGRSIRNMIIHDPDNKHCGRPQKTQTDRDGDGIDDVNDNCAGQCNPLQKDTDGDGIGDKCDNCRDTPDQRPQGDGDGDGVGDACDHCPGTEEGREVEHDGNPRAGCSPGQTPTK